MAREILVNNRNNITDALKELEAMYFSGIISERELENLTTEIILLV